MLHEHSESRSDDEGKLAHFGVQFEVRDVDLFEAAIERASQAIARLADETERATAAIERLSTAAREVQQAREETP